MVAWEENEKAAMQYLEHKYCLHCGKSLKSPAMRRNRYFCLCVGLLGICALIALAKIGGWW